MSQHQPTHPGLLSGIKSRCPFCLARNRGLPKLGERVRILSDDMMTGKIGTVVENIFRIPLQPGDILLHMDSTPPGQTQTFNVERDLLGPIPDTPFPPWALPIYLESAEELDRFVVRFCEQSEWGKRQILNWEAFYDLLGLVWQKRLHISSKEMWAVLAAHGIHHNWENRCTKLYHEGMDLLVRVTHRKPFMTNRLRSPQYLRKPSLMIQHWLST